MTHIEKTYVTEEGEIVREVLDASTGVWQIGEKLTAMDMLRISLNMIDTSEIVYEPRLISNANTQG